MAKKTKKKITEELPEATSLTEELPEPPNKIVKVLYDPERDTPGILDSKQVQPGEIHNIPYGAYLAVKNNKAYKVVE